MLCNFWEVGCTIGTDISDDVPDVVDSLSMTAEIAEFPETERRSPEFLET